MTYLLFSFLSTSLLTCFFEVKHKESLLKNNTNLCACKKQNYSCNTHLPKDIKHKIVYYQVH